MSFVRKVGWIYSKSEATLVLITVENISGQTMRTENENLQSFLTSQ